MEGATMTPLLLLAAGAGEGQFEQIARTFGVDWPHFAAQLVSFSIVCAVLYRFAYGPILAMLQERREQIAQGLANAGQIKAELARTETQRQEVIAAAHREADLLVEEARAAAARMQQQEVLKASAVAEDIIQRARDAAAQDYARMLSELKAEVGRLVVQTTGAVISRVLSPEDQRRLAQAAAERVSV
jgi:F-type H+-transporting ATPase subunit b